MWIVLLLGLGGLCSMVAGLPLIGIMLLGIAVVFLRVELKEGEKKEEYVPDKAPISGGASADNTDDLLDCSLTDDWSQGESYTDSGWDFLGFGDD